MPNFYIRPACDAQGNAKRVPDPETGAPLPAAGANKPRLQYWLRRLAAGDVTEGESPAVSLVPAVLDEPAAPVSAEEKTPLDGSSEKEISPKRSRAAAAVERNSETI